MGCWKVGDKPTFFNGKNLMLKENQKSQHGLVRNLTSLCDDLLLLFFWLLFLVQFQPVSKKWMTGVVSSISNNKLQTEFFVKIDQQWSLQVDGYILQFFRHGDNHSNTQVFHFIRVQFFHVVHSDVETEV